MGNSIKISKNHFSLKDVDITAIFNALLDFLTGFWDRVPIWRKSNLTLKEAAAYSGIGVNSLRELTDEEDCNFVLWVGRKRLIKRRLLDVYTDGCYSI